jgi:multisubunit Na+/H+ antiporter MnhB subunit
MARRFILATVIVFLGAHQTFQLILAETVCICLLVYQIRYSPMKESLFNRLEYLNEVTLLSTTLLMTCFTDYTPNKDKGALAHWMALSEDLGGRK